LVLPCIHFGYFKFDEFLTNNYRGHNWVAGGHPMTVQYGLNVLFLREGYGLCISVTHNFHAEYPMHLSKVCSRKNGSNLFFEKDDYVDEFTE
jgi:hypothetical protein